MEHRYRCGWVEHTSPPPSTTQAGGGGSGGGGGISVIMVVGVAAGVLALLVAGILCLRRHRVALAHSFVRNESRRFCEGGQW